MDNEGQVTSPQTSGVADATTTQTVPTATVASDATKDWQTEIQKTKEKYEHDINNVKSVLQKQLSDQEKIFKTERDKYTAQIRELQMATMDESQRSAYAQKIEKEDLEALRQQNQQLQAALQEQETIQSYTNFFIEKGVRREDLLHGKGVNALVNSGWEALSRKIKMMDEELTRLKTTPQAAKDGVTPPQIITPGGGLPPLPPSEAELIKQYGSMEKVYNLVEQGNLSASIIPK
jgi:chromosome segregation ATPase